MSMKIKVPVQDLEKNDAYDKIVDKLSRDPDNAYTIMGLMVEVFGVKKEDIMNKPFRDWAKGLPSLYTRIRLYLNDLKNGMFVKSKKHGKAWVYYWDKKDWIKNVNRDAILNLRLRRHRKW